MCILNILFGFISEDVAALMGILYTMSLQVPVFLSWLALPNCLHLFPGQTLACHLMSGVLGDLVGFRFGHLGFKDMDPVKPETGLKIIAGLDVLYDFCETKRHETKWNEMKWLFTIFLFGWSVISKVVALSSTVQSWVWTMVGLGERWIFFCWPQTRTWRKIRAVEHGTFFLAEVRLFKTFGKIVPAMNFRFCDVSFERRRCV